jgi:SdrD B-like domain
MIPHLKLMKEHLFLIVVALYATASNVIATPIFGTSQLGGWVYIDRNNDGHLAFSNEPNPEFAIGGVDISLLSTLGGVQTLVSMTQSDDFGRYLFENINPGTYVLSETPPVEFVDGIDTLGILQSVNGQPIPGNASAGVMTDNTFSSIVLTAELVGEFYNFGERGLAAGFASKRFLFATAPGLNTLPPPPPGTAGNPTTPEPTSLIIALMAGCGSLLALRRLAQR